VAFERSNGFSTGQLAETNIVINVGRGGEEVPWSACGGEDGISLDSFEEIGGGKVPKEDAAISTRGGKRVVVREPKIERDRG